MEVLIWCLFVSVVVSVLAVVCAAAICPWVLWGPMCVFYATRGLWELERSAVSTRGCVEMSRGQYVSVDVEPAKRENRLKNMRFPEQIELWADVKAWS